MGLNVMFKSIRNKKQERIFKAHFRCGPVCIENGRFRNEALLKISAPNAIDDESVGDRRHIILYFKAFYNFIFTLLFGSVNINKNSMNDIIC